MYGIATPRNGVQNRVGGVLRDASLPDAELANALQVAFGQAFALVDLATGELRHGPSDWLAFDIDSRLPLLEEVHRHGRPEIIEDFAPLFILAVPLPIDEQGPTSLIAVTTMLSQPTTAADDLAAAARALRIDVDHAVVWASRHRVWPTYAAIELARSIEQNIANRHIEQTIRGQLSNVSRHLLQSLEELSLLHRLTEQLTLARSGDELTSMALEWLGRVVPARALGVYFSESATCETTDDQRVLMWGDCPIAHDEVPRLIEQLGPSATTDCLLFDRRALSSPHWGYPDITQLICVPIRTADRHLGWLIALGHRFDRHCRDSEFGVIESSLLSSVAAILAVHFGNLQAFREQGEFFSSVVKALSSAIDAKDPYTRGHSERVARISVCLAKHLGCNDDELNTLYFAGLMHDIGKIGIDDAVLRKPGQLTPEEFDLIKLHPQLGHDILAGVKQLEHLLPIVLHHHENWNGKGYPMGLAGNDCPKLARIAAVADAFDAMSSDRPYRKGMDDDKLHEILRSGAGKQWDPVVVAAFFEAREEIRQIVDEANAELTPLTAAPRSSTKFESTKFESPAWHATSCPAKT